MSGHDQPAIAVATSSASLLPTVGSKWVLQGLKGAAHLNGVAVTVVFLKEGEGRVVAQTEDGQTAGVKPENLASLLPAVGTQWALKGLKGQAHLNGLVVTVAGLKKEEGRIVVKTEDGQTAAVKPDNLERLMYVD